MSASSPPSRRRSRGPAAVAVAVLILGTLTAGAAPVLATPAAERVAPLLGTQKPSAIEGSYIVVLRDGATRAVETGAVREARAEGARRVDRFATVLDGFSAELSDSALEEVRSNPEVDYVEADEEVSVATTQSPATWGLDRIDQRKRPLTDSYTYVPTGLGVTAYIIDTGIRETHNELDDRVSPGHTVIRDGRGATDCNGHGTHVAGTVGGSAHGVAKQVTLVPVRVLACNGSGSRSGVIAGIDWVTRNHTSGPAIANLSLGGGASRALDDAVRRSISDGVTYAVAAGNAHTNACKVSPARVGGALTVGSTTSTDARSRFSNIGSCLDIFAPGSRITSAWFTRDGATKTISGTSMAAPHVAGAAALYLQGHPKASPRMVSRAIVNGATPRVVTRAGNGSPKRLLYSRLG